MGIAADGAGNLALVTGDIGPRIHHLDLAAGQLAVVKAFPAGDGGGHTITGFLVGGDGRYYFSQYTQGPSSVSNLVEALDPPSGAITTVGTLAGGAGEIADDGAGHIFVLDGADVRRLDVATGALTTIAAGVGAIHVAWDGQGSLYVVTQALPLADGLYWAPSGAALARISIATGAITPVAGLGTFQTFGGIAADPAGVVYVADPRAHQVRALDAATGAIVTVAGEDTHKGVKPGALPGGLSLPARLALFRSGEVAIADNGEDVVLIARLAN
jgi:hypothetical protein